MIKKKRKGLFVKVYLSLLIFVLSFFMIFAYRNEVLKEVYKKNVTAYQLSKQEEKEIIKKLENIDAKRTEKEKVKQVFLPYQKEFLFNVLVENPQIEDAEVNPAVESYLYIGGSAPKISIQNAYDFRIEAPNTTWNIIVYPLFTQFYTNYTLIALCISVMISVLFYGLLCWLVKSQKGNAFLRKVGARLPNKVFHRLSTQLLLVNIMAAMLAFSCFFFMYHHRYAFFDFLKTFYPQSEIAEKVGVKVETQLQDIPLDKEHQEEVNKVLSISALDNMAIYIFDQGNIMYEGTGHARIIEEFSRGSMYDVFSVSSADAYIHDFKAKDQFASLTIYHYPLAAWVNPYLFVIIMIALTLYLIPLLSFIDNKVKHIKRMQEDIAILSTGNWNHPVSVIGNDEIAGLGENLNQMRHSFLENTQREAEARNANKELITSLSHDLRTPLTSLMGYLDIIKYDKCKEEQKSEYLEKSAHKVEQIRSLSDKMFEYFLIYGEEENVELSLQSTEEWMEYVKECTSLFEQQGYTFKISLCEYRQTLSLNMPMMKRVMDNLYSNIQKYADKSEDIVIMSEVKENTFHFLMSNKKREGSEEVESNHIGLKSVEKIVEIHHGEIFIQDEKDHFMIILSFPLKNSSKH